MSKLIEDIKNMEAMKYCDKPDDSSLSANLLKKKYDMINNVGDAYMATQKWDGYWMMYIRGEGDDITIRGRNKNKAGEYENYAIKLPHIVEAMKAWPENTVILGEVCWPELGMVATDVGVILRCLPKTAISRQEHKKLVVRAFDLLVYKDEDLRNDGYETRFERLNGFLSDNVNDYIRVTNVVYNDFLGFADDIIREGGEGCVIYCKNYPYEPGKRAAWKTLKLKQHLDSAVYKVTKTLSPKVDYEGKCLDTWNYWAGIDSESKSEILFNHCPTDEEKKTLLSFSPVTKPYFMNWKVGVTIELPSGVFCDVSSGLTDVQREWLTTDEAVNLIKEGKLFAHVRAMQEATLGGLRHPVFEDFEFDKDVER